MIKDSKLLEQFEKKQIKKEKLSYLKALKIFESLWKEGLKLKVLPLKNTRKELEVDIKIAKILNSCLKNL